MLRKELKINWTSVSIVTGGVEVLVDLWLSRRLNLGLVWVNFWGPVRNRKRKRSYFKVTFVLPAEKDWAWSPPCILLEIEGKMLCTNYILLSR